MTQDNQQTSIILYDGGLDLRLDKQSETIWVSLDQIADIFGRDKSVISRHIKNIFSEEELIRDTVVAKDGKTYQVDYYNLDMVLSVGYRVNSKIATKFRQWATRRLKEYLIQGVSINQKRLDEINRIIRFTFSFTYNY